MSVAGRREVLEEILASPELTTKVEKSLLEKITEWLGLDQVGIPSLPAGVATWVALGALCVGVVFVVWVIVSRFLLRRAGGAASVDRSALPVARVLDPVDALRHARSAEEAGRLRSALHWVHLAALIVLRRKGLSRAADGATNREVLDDLPPEPAGTFRPLVDSFDGIWYGGRSCDADALTRHREGVAALERVESGRARVELVVVIALFVVLLGAMALSFGSATGRAQRRIPGATTHSTGPGGLRALERWVTRGFDRPAVRIEGGEFTIPEDTGVLVLAATPQPLEEAEAEAIRTFVRGGGMLLLAGVPPQVRMKLEVEFPTAGPRSTTTGRLGRGRIVAVATVEPLTTKGLTDEGSSAFVDGLLRVAPPGAVAFDEYHHGYRETRGLPSVLTNTAPGVALLFVVLAVFVHLVLGGRRFARPLPLGRERRRSGADFVRAMAETYRRAGRSADLFEGLAASWRKRLARSAGVAPDAADPALARAAGATLAADPGRIEDVLREITMARDLSPAARRDLLSTMDTIRGQSRRRGVSGG